MIRSHVALPLAVVVIVVSGCASTYKISEPNQLNHWIGTDKKLSAIPADDVWTYISWAPESKGIRLVPGMRLSVVSSSLAPAGTNTQIPIISTFDWVLPERRRYMPGDFVALGHFAGAGTAVQPSYQPIKQFGTMAEMTSRDLSEFDLPDKVGEVSLQRMLESIQLLNGLPARSSKEAAATDEVWKGQIDPNKTMIPIRLADRRASLCLPSRTAQADGSDKQPTQKLTFDVLVSGDGSVTTWEVEYSAFSAYYLSPTFGIDISRKSRTNDLYLNAKINGILSYIEVDVPVRLSDRDTSDFFPACWTYQDLESRLGATIVGFKRTTKYFPQTIEAAARSGSQKNGLEPLQDEDRKRLTLPGQYFEVTFVPDIAHPPFGVGDKAFLAGSARKSELLIAPGDLVLVQRSASQLTDSPGYRARITP